jgi:hypothetical protein
VGRAIIIIVNQGGNGFTSVLGIRGKWTVARCEREIGLEKDGRMPATLRLTGTESTTAVCWCYPGSVPVDGLLQRRLPSKKVRAYGGMGTHSGVGYRQVA